MAEKSWDEWDTSIYYDVQNAIFTDPPPPSPTIEEETSDLSKDRAVSDEVKVKLGIPADGDYHGSIQNRERLEVRSGLHSARSASYTGHTTSSALNQQLSSNSLGGQVRPSPQEVPGNRSASPPDKQAVLAPEGWAADLGSRIMDSQTLSAKGPGASFRERGLRPRGRGTGLRYTRGRASTARPGSMLDFSRRILGKVPQQNLRDVNPYAAGGGPSVNKSEWNHDLPAFGIGQPDSMRDSPQSNLGQGPQQNGRDVNPFTGRGERSVGYPGWNHVVPSLGDALSETAPNMMPQGTGTAAEMTQRIPSQAHIALPTFLGQTSFLWAAPGPTYPASFRPFFISPTQHRENNDKTSVLPGTQTRPQLTLYHPGRQERFHVNASLEAIMAQTILHQEFPERPRLCLEEILNLMNHVRTFQEDPVSHRPRVFVSMGAPESLDFDGQFNRLTQTGLSDTLKVAQLLQEPRADRFPDLAFIMQLEGNYTKCLIAGGPYLVGARDRKRRELWIVLRDLVRTSEPFYKWVYVGFWDVVYYPAWTLAQQLARVQLG